MTTCSLLDEVKKLRQDIHGILSQEKPSSQLMDGPFERLLEASKKFRQMDDKDPERKKIEEVLSEINSEITAHEEREILLGRFPELAHLPKKPKKRL